MYRNIVSLIFVAFIVAVGLAPPSATAAANAALGKSRYLAASVLAKPDLRCALAATSDTAPAMQMAVYTDHDGYARFFAIRAKASDAVQQLSLTCTDASGKIFRYKVDLTSAETFAAHPLNLSDEPGTDRPALQGDPDGYSQAQLVKAGFGLRPDAKQSPDAYARWLQAASRPGRFLDTKRSIKRAPSAISYGTTSTTAPYWVGSALVGFPQYTSVESSFNVPTAIGGGDQTTNTAISIWNGLGGFGTGSGLIQGGVTIQTSPTAAFYGVFREYCCGDPDSNGYGGAFTPNPGDQIYSQQWYCDASGNLDLNGGYGCSFLENLTSGAILNCTQANGSPCWSVQALPQCSVDPTAGNCMTLGYAAEFVIENQSPQISSTSTAFTDFTPQVTMSGSAYSAKTQSSKTVNTDSAVDLLTDFTDTTTRMTVSLGTTAETYFGTSATLGTIRKYTGAPCNGGFCTGWTTFDDNSLTNAIAASGSNFYQLHTTGSIWKSTGTACSGTYCPGWTKFDDNPAAIAIVADSNNLYQLHNTGEIWKSTGAPCDSNGCAGWIRLDINPLTVQIAASGGHLYQRHSTGSIWKWTGTACSGTSCPGWIRIDDNPLATTIVADGNSLYQLHNNGHIWKWDGGGCEGASCPSWSQVDDNGLTVKIAAAGGSLYQLHSTGSIWKWTGAVCGTSCAGWVRIGDNAAAVGIVAESTNLWELDNSGQVSQWDGGGCTGASCSSWTELDANPYNSQLAAGGGHLYSLLQ